MAPGKGVPYTPWNSPGGGGGGGGGLFSRGTSMNQSC